MQGLTVDTDVLKMPLAKSCSGSLKFDAGQPQ